MKGVWEEILEGVKNDPNKNPSRRADRRAESAVKWRGQALLDGVYFGHLPAWEVNDW
jgi:hypothetical protein